MYQRVLLHSGQFLLDPASIEVDLEKFTILVEAVLGIWSGQSPVVKKFNIDILQTSYTFSTTGQHGVPTWISRAVPLLKSGSSWPFYQRQNYNPELVDKCPAPFEYRKETLYVSVPAKYDITAVYDHILEGSTPDDYEVSTISYKDDIFFKLLTGHFLIALAGSRRAFTLDPVEISTDADTMKSEGKEMVDEAEAQLDETESDFYLAWS